MNLLIVDDELSAIQAVRNGVDWNTLPFDEVYSAQGMNEAVNILESRSIELVLCDIEMPQGTGLDLLRWLKEHRPETMLVFMTCYAEFTYAQEAMRLGALDYVLKPLDYNHLESVLRGAIEKITQYKHLQQTEALWQDSRRDSARQFWRDFFVGDIAPNEESVTQWWDKRGAAFTIEGMFIPILIRIQQSGSSSVLSDPKVLTDSHFDMPDTHHESILFSSGMILVILRRTTPFDRHQFGVAIVQRCEALNDSIAHELNASSRCLIGEAVPLYQIPEQLEQLQTIDYANNNAAQRLFFLSSYNQRKSFERYSAADSVRLADHAARFVEDHLLEDIQISDVADSLHLNADYLSRIFKKERGAALNSFIISRKLEKAKELLDNTNLPLSEIASRLGYLNYSSFYRIFVKILGMTPQEYKAQSSSRN